ncbi:MAG: type III-A CRISPR-associated protein Cas10/Csm1 [Candidatus Margulisbacteria bacterium GWF2_38_17]|nr:MAG: type III-A CRISPR-associated protein Cas10/Csm1 [Candidatus Margulisbacteria bacterium GWD2_39_127]OGI04856.1 MAG: type III-A CRISPR-associated protein Cas10/Csm1 [Candidatus Margulisbacteria bacterium GWF2_38_17]
MDNKERNTVVLAALLHDVGKFRQRTGEQIANDYDESCCPVYNNRLTHLHAGHTAKCLRETDAPGEIIDIAARHHLGDTLLDEKEGYLTAIVKKADWLSSGLDRDSIKAYDRDTEDNKDRLSKDQQNYKAARLETIFEQILGGSGKNLVCDLAPLTPENCNPVSKESARKLYSDLYNDFKVIAKKIFRDLDIKNFNQDYLTVQSLLEKYTWCIPSSAYKVLPNVSLFDHSRTTATFADALYAYHKHSNSLRYKAIVEGDSKQSKFILIQGDFSGIQDFIFNLKDHSHAAKILRARSFFVSVATDIAAYKLCDKTGLTPAAIVMNAGGKFTILAPNLPSTRKAVEDVESEVNHDFRQRTYGQTRMNIAYVEVCEEDFYTHIDGDEKFSKKMRQLSSQVEKRKLQYHIDSPVFTDYIDGFTQGNTESAGLCKSCNANPVHDGIFCSQCADYDQIGKEIINADYVSIGKTVRGHKILSDYYISFKADKNADYLFALRDDLDVIDKNYPIKRYAGNMPELTSEDMNDNRFANMTEQQFDNNEFNPGFPKTFAHIAYQALNKDTEKGKPFLGIIKADVDNLGYIFSKGFTEINKENLPINKASFSKYASLSRMLDYFFTVVLIDHVKKKDLNVYTVFAGGDDLFLIGSWNQMMDLAGWINYNFAKFVGDNPNIHLSMGVVLAKPSLPVPKMAEISEEQLQLSKNKGKNAFSMFGQTASWNEYDDLMKFQKTIEDIEGKYKTQIKEGLPTQYFYKILHFAEMADGHDPRDSMWQALFHYITAKNYKNEKESNLGLQRDLLDLSKEIKKWGTRLKIPMSKMIYEERE